MRKIIKLGNKGVSEVVGTVILLAIAVSTFSVVAMYVFSINRSENIPNVTLVGYMNENDHVIIEHKGGEDLKLDKVEIIIRKGEIKSERISFDAEGNSREHVIFRRINKDDKWNVGESVDADAENLFNEEINYWQISVIVVDKESNSVVMFGVVQTGIVDYLFKDNSSIEGGADFTWHPNPTCVNIGTRFTDASLYQEYIISWNWSFGDGSYSNEKNPTHVYENPGTYNVILNVTYASSVIAPGVKNWDDVSHLVYVSDIPRIVDNSPSEATTGDPYTFLADVSDSDGISSVWIEYWFGNGASINTTMNNTGGNSWEYTMYIPMNSLEPLHYIISANDTNDFWNNSGILTKEVLDNDPPEIVDFSPSNGTTGDPYTFLVNVIDNIDSGGNIEVKINWSHASLGGNSTMSFIGENSYTLTITLSNNSINNMVYIIYAKDSSGNINSSNQRSVAVYDNDPPLITDYSSQWAFWDDNFKFNASVIDNIGVAAVYVIYWIDNGSQTNRSMIIEGNYYTYTYHVPVNGNTLYYKFVANDTSNNWAETGVFNRTLYRGHVYNVDQNKWYDEIYDATKDANPGDTIYVYPGTYHTHGQGTQDIVIDDNGVELIGRSAPDTIILVSQQDGITVTASDIVIKNITMIKNANAPPAKSFKKGIYLYGASNVTIENCNISGASQSAIYIVASHYIFMNNCILYNNLQHGVYIGDDSYNVNVLSCQIYNNSENGILIEQSDSNIISNNEIHNNRKGIYIHRALYNNITQNDIYWNNEGIYLEGVSQESTKLNTIYKNVIHHNSYGIYFSQYSTDNTITYNKIHNNTKPSSTGYGIYIYYVPNKENNYNHIYQNNFMNNDGNAYDECSNYWNASLGNYWDDYTGSDANGDGIGDIPYSIPGGNNKDNKPLMSPVET